MYLHQIIEQLKPEWDRTTGFFGMLRIGILDESAFERVLKLILSINIDGKSIDRRLVTLLWDIPLFMEWQSERMNASVLRYAQVKSVIYEAVHGILNYSQTWD
jgi:hypothetical protein